MGLSFLMSRSVAVWTNQGYIAFLPNPTGSTTFGQSFTDAIAEDWGGKPFVDMRKGWAHVLKNVSPRSY